MDDGLELPSSHVATSEQQREDDAVGSSDEEDGGPDWTNLPTGSSSLLRPVLPKRGEKEHEPGHEGETRLQSHVLGRAREAMFSALSAQRGSSSKTLSHAVWYPSLARAHVTVARGIHFTSLGHSVSRPVHMNSQPSDGGAENIVEHKRLELLPEETLYLIERGTLACSLAYDESREHIPGLIRPAISVQHAYASMIGTVDLTLEKYQVYAYLKRLGYVVTRAEPPTTAYPVYQRAALRSIADKHHSGGGWLHSLLAFALRSFTVLIGVFKPRSIDWWHPLSISSLRPLASASLFQTLRHIASPCGHTFSLAKPTEMDLDSPYRVFFNLYKPPTPFKKTAPPEPDFQVVVINAQTTPMPTLREMDALFAQAPELPPPQPRKKNPLLNKLIKVSEATGAITDAKAVSQTSTTQPWTKRIQSFFGLSSTTPDRPLPRPNPFGVLKQGKKTIVVAVVDVGSVGFFRFGQGCFEEWPMA